MQLDAATLGNILTIFQILGILGGGLWAIARVEAKIGNLTISHSNFVGRLDKMDNKLDAFNNVLIQLAKQEERMTAQDLRLQELSARLDSMRFLQHATSQASAHRDRQKRG